MASSKKSSSSSSSEDKAQSCPSSRVNGEQPTNETFEPVSAGNKAGTHRDVQYSDKEPSKVMDKGKENMDNPDSTSDSDSLVEILSLMEDIYWSMIDGEELDVSFDRFPYFLSEITKTTLILAAYVHLKRIEYIKYTPGLPTVNPKILLSGPAGSEIYQETLIKALANCFKAKLLIFDGDSFSAGASSQIIDHLVDKTSLGTKRNSGPGTSTTASLELNQQQFREGDRVMYAGLSDILYHSRGPAFGQAGKLLLHLEDGHSSRMDVRFDEPIPGGVDLWGLCEENHGFFCKARELVCLASPGVKEKHEFLMDIFEVVSNASTESPIILYMKNIEKSIVGNVELCSTFSSIFEEIPNGVLIVASEIQRDTHREKSRTPQSRIGALLAKMGLPHATLQELFQDKFLKLHEEMKDVPKTLADLFLNKVTIYEPQDESLLVDWKHRLNQDVETLKEKESLTRLRTALNRSGLEWDQSEKLFTKNHLVTEEEARKVAEWALNHYVMQNPETVEDTKPILTSLNIQYALGLLQATKCEPTSSKKSLKDVVIDNKFERSILDDVMLPSDVGVTFDEIGALEDVKDTLKELVMLPLQRPELFSKGQLTKPCKGILLFGPPGTGKTMLAKAVATEAGANFINISMSSITSQWHGECEKYVKAVFSLASKIAPSVIFVDEVDSMLGRRERPGENETTRKMKNEFMMNWDGLRTNDKERVLVLAATNRPYDLDEAVIRRLPRRLMVGLPDSSNRSKILEVILSKEDLSSEVDLDAIANWTNGYSGSDIKILEVILSKEDLSSEVDLDAIANWTNGYSGSDIKNLCVTAAYSPIRELLEKEKQEKAKATVEGKPPLPPSPIKIRSLSMDDFRRAHEQVGASVASESASMNELVTWNETYGEGGSRKKRKFSYFS